MALACALCGGVGFGHIDRSDEPDRRGYVDDGIPCSCNPDAEPREPESFRPREEKKRTLMWGGRTW